MFRVTTKQSTASSIFGMFELIFHASVRHVRKAHGNAIIGLALNIFQNMLMIAVFFAMVYFLGFNMNRVRGNFLLYIMSGVFMFMTHVKALGAVVKTDGPTSPMMKHAPMNTIVAISAAALGSLYLQMLSALVILFSYNALVEPIHINNIPGTLAMFLLSWLSGVAIGMIFKAAMPWQPDVFGVASQVFMRANMIASGKMFLGNSMTAQLLVFFTWNPLFHTIDQGRGFIFENYHPRNSSIEYPLIVTAVCLVIGLMGEYYTRKHASSSWSAGR